jgi:hypothetical protein
MIGFAFNYLKSIPSRMLFSWAHFWFEAQPFAQLRVFRMVLGACLLMFFTLRTFDLELLYTNAGILPLDALNSVVATQLAPSVFHYFPSRASIWIGHITLLVFTFLLMLGKFPRISAVVVYILHVSFDNRDPAIVYGFNKVATFFLLNLTLASYSESQATEGSIRRALASLALRLTQIQLCIIYLFAGTEKLKGPLWWRGEAIWGVLANAQTTTFDFGFMAHLPLVITLATYATLIWEIYFPVVVWSGRFRYLWLFGGVILHGSIGIMMNLPFFAWIMVAAYAVFLRPEHASSLERSMLSSLNRLGDGLRIKRRSEVLSDPDLSTQTNQA